MKNAQNLLAYGVGACGIALALAAPPAHGETLITLYTFTGGADGSEPLSGLLPGPNGSFYGTTSGGNGTIFQVSPPNQGHNGWTLTTLYSFSGGADGSFPEHLVSDRSGALYGMTNSGGTFDGNCAFGGTDYGCGTVFKLAPPAQGQRAWTLDTLYSFSGGTDSGGPTGGVVMDDGGNLIGFTAGIYQCGNGACGSAYELSPPSVNGHAWTLTTLHNFTGGRDGGYIGYFGLPLLGSDGTIFGIAGTGGDLTGPNCAPLGGCGLVFQLTPPTHGRATWRNQSLLIFNGRDGITPTEGLVQDSHGILLGTAIDGGLLDGCVPGSGYPNGCGVLYAVPPAPPGHDAGSATILHRFTNGADGGYPLAPPLLDGPAVVISTSGDEVATFGSIDEVAPPKMPGANRHVRTLFTFTNDANGSDTAGTLVKRNGAIYGTTAGSGTGPAANGTIFKLWP